MGSPELCFWTPPCALVSSSSVSIDIVVSRIANVAKPTPQLPTLLLHPPQQPPCAEGQESEARSPRDVLRQAANGHDREGLTPLLVTLRALGRHKEDRGEPRARLLALLRFLLEELGADAAAAVRGGRGPSALHLAALCPGAEAVELLLQHKPLLEPLDPDGLTPLARALALGNCAAARALVSRAYSRSGGRLGWVPVGCFGRVEGLELGGNVLEVEGIC